MVNIIIREIETTKDIIFYEGLWNLKVYQCDDML